VGRFLASLRIPTLRTFKNIHELDGLREEFLESYLAQTPGEVARIRLFEAASLVTSAASAFRIQRANWNEEVSLLLDESERVFAEARRSSPVPAASATPPALPWNERVRWAGDPAYVQAMVDRPVLDAHQVVVDGCELLRAVETGKAFNARFRLMGSRDGDRWRSTIRVAVSKRKGGYTTHKLLADHYPLVEEHPETLHPPRPLIYMLRLSASVTESCGGRGLHSLQNAREVTDAMVRVGRGLAVWHSGTRAGSPAELGPSHRSNPNRIYRAPLDERFQELVKEAVALLSESDESPVRLLHHVRLHDVVIAPHQVGLTYVPAVYHADPRHDVATMVAAWRLRGITCAEESLCAAAVEAFVTGYEEAAGGPLEGLAPFEALALAERAHQLRGNAAALSSLSSMAAGRLAEG
jgi:hypothetical protein